MPKEEGLIASEADLLNTELRENYGHHLQVDVEDDWRPAIRGLVDGVRYGEEFNRRQCEKQQAEDETRRDSKYCHICGLYLRREFAGQTCSERCAIIYRSYIAVRRMQDGLSEG